MGNKPELRGWSKSRMLFIVGLACVGAVVYYFVGWLPPTQSSVETVLKTRPSTLLELDHALDRRVMGAEIVVPLYSQERLPRPSSSAQVYWYDKAYSIDEVGGSIVVCYKSLPDWMFQRVPTGGFWVYSLHDGTIIGWWAWPDSE